MPAHPVILFDGVCNYCDAVVNFLIRRDKKGRLRFAALQSEAGQQLLREYGLPEKNFDSFVLIENGKVFSRSTAVFRIVPYLSYWWQWARIGWIAPRPLRDAIYNLVARNRYRWFGRRDSCMIPSAEVRGRFL